VNRRAFLAGLGGVAAMPSVVHAQAVKPVIGFLNNFAPETSVERLRMFRVGLREAGYVEGENLAVEYRWAENQFSRLPDLAADLVRRKVAVLVAAGSNPTALAAKAATSTIPSLFIVSEDPVRLGLVGSLARPDTNMTGVNFLNAELVTKRLDLLLELVPAAVRVAALVNPSNTTTTEAMLRDIEPVVRSKGLQLQVIKAGNSAEINAAFSTFASDRPHALFVMQDGLFGSRRVQLASLAARYGIPATYSTRDYAEVGGLMSYGAHVAGTYHQVGIYTGRILKGAKPADLPVVQSTRFELVINAETARMLGITVPASLMAQADVVIE
jgi:putative ABC transport system substrate-binding protein